MPPKLSTAWHFADKVYMPSKYFGEPETDPGDEQPLPDGVFLHFVGPMSADYREGQDAMLFGANHKVLAVDRGKGTITVVKQ